MNLIEDTSGHYSQAGSFEKRAVWGEMREFQLASGSVPGADHVRAGRNNQDSRHVIVRDDAIVSVVCDGLSKMIVKDGGTEAAANTRNEVGAIMGAMIVSQKLLDLADVLRDTPEDAPEEAVTRHVKTYLTIARRDIRKVLRAIMSELGLPPALLVQDLFLFTIVAAIVTPSWSAFVHLGDGYVNVNGEGFKIGPFPNNEPPVISYGSDGTSLPEEALEFKILKILKTSGLESFLIGSDGLTYLIDAQETGIPGQEQPIGPISRIWTEDRFFTNKDMVRRHLTVINDGIRNPGKGVLKDDTTLVVGRRRRVQDA